MGTTLLSVSAGDIVAWADKATDDAAKAAATYEALGFAFGTIAIIVIIQRLFKGFMGDPVRPPRPADHDRRRLRIGKDRLLGRG